SGSVYDHASNTIVSEGEIYPSIDNPTTIYNNIVRLFDMSGGEPEPNQGSYAISRGAHALDLAKDDLLRIKAKTLSASDKMKLEAWENLLGDIGGMIGGGGGGPAAACNEDIATQLGLTS